MKRRCSSSRSLCAAEVERKAEMRRRYEARRILKRANDIFEKNREAAEGSGGSGG